jgi:hypothetical protein
VLGSASLPSSIAPQAEVTVQDLVKPTKAMKIKTAVATRQFANKRANDQPSALLELKSNESHQLNNGAITGETTATNFPAHGAQTSNDTMVFSQEYGLTAAPYRLGESVVPTCTDLSLVESFLSTTPDNNAPSVTKLLAVTSVGSHALPFTSQHSSSPNTTKQLLAAALRSTVKSGATNSAIAPNH